MTNEELSQMVELLRDTAKLHQPNEEILTDVKAESFVFIMDSVLSALSVPEKETDADGQIYHISLVTDIPKEEKGEMKHIYCPKCGFKMDIIKPISNLFNFCPWCASYVEKRGGKE